MEGTENEEEKRTKMMMGKEEKDIYKMIKSLLQFKTFK